MVKVRERLKSSMVIILPTQNLLPLTSSQQCRYCSLALENLQKTSFRHMFSALTNEAVDYYFHSL